MLNFESWEVEFIGYVEPCELLCFLADFLRQASELYYCLDTSNVGKLEKPLCEAISGQLMAAVTEEDGTTAGWEHRESIMGTHAELSSPEWVHEWFLWNTNSLRWTTFRTGAHDWFYSYHKFFFCPVITLKKSKITLKSPVILMLIRFQSDACVGSMSN